MSRHTWPIVIGGCHRSGTSMLRRTLNAHSRIHCGPEVKFFRDFYGDYEDDPLRSFRFPATARAILPEDELLDELGAAFVRVHERASARAGKCRWADKAPENVLYLRQWQRLLGDRWLFVHVVRHPLDTLASIKETRFQRTIPADLDRRIAFYRQYTQAGLDFTAAAPDRSVRVVYDRFVRAPEDGLRVLMRCLDEEAEPGQIAFNEQPQDAGLEDPKVAATTRIHAESVSRWPAVLTPDEARVAWESTRDLWAAVSDESAAGIEPGDQLFENSGWAVSGFEGSSRSSPR